MILLSLEKLKNLNTMLNKRVKQDNYTYNVKFFDLNNSVDYNNLNTLLNSNSNIIVVDEIKSQVKELLKLRHPNKKLTAIELDKLTNKYLPKNTDKYGVWVYYPWQNKLVHLLNKEEYIEVRTNRNHYKITPEEEELLFTKKIGIIGLSVGKAIALTIATERICGEIVLADFDEIELSNLNRIQTGVTNFGVKKTVVAAREIAEIDPYIKVICLSDGLSEENIDKFFNDGKKLDICIEVCDGLMIKILARQKAKELGVPVVMNSSDRGTTDVERFDLNPDLPILHGLIDHLDLEKVKEAKTNEEKVPYLLPMLGIETSSERLKASMLEIESSITTWPQLASGVIMGGGICTDVCRRILLNQFTNSGRYFVDVETEINNDVIDYIEKTKKTNQSSKSEKLTDKDYKELIRIANNRLFNEDHKALSLQKEQIEELVSAGITAPSAGNIQPWKWIYKNKKLLLVHDVIRGKSILNYRDTASLMGLGAAAENIILKAHELNLEVKLDKFPVKDNPNIYASFNFYNASNTYTEPHDNFFLAEAIPHRITNRTLGKRQLLPEDVERYLKDIAKSVTGAKLKIFSNPTDIEILKEIIAEIDWIIMTNKSCHKQFMHEIRWNQKEVETTKDGLDLNTFDITPTERAGLMVSKNWNVTKHIKKWGLGKEFGKMSRKAIDACSALGLITMPKKYPETYFDGGRVIQKVWLGATKKGIAFQPMSLSTFLSERIADNNFEQLEDVKDKVTNLYSKLKTTCNVGENETDIFLFRLSFADNPKVKPLRRDIEDVLIYEKY